MKHCFLFAILAFILPIKSAYAVQSTITEAEGYSCMGDDKSRKQTEQAAMIDAKKNAAEYTSTYIKSEIQIKDFVLQKDLVTAYTNAEVVVIEDLDKGWYKDPSAGDCYKIKIKAEVVPDQKAMERIALVSAGTGTEGNIRVPVAPPPVPDSGSYAAQGTAITPDVVVVPSGTTYVYMVPNTAGVYFYNGYWFRYYEGYWFHAPSYGRSWGMVDPVAVPRAVVNVPPEYPRYLPPTYKRIHYDDLHQHWQSWDRTNEWHKHDWFKNEMKPEVVQERQALIQQEREEHRIKRERIRQTKEQNMRQQQEQRRLKTEHKRQEAKQQAQRNQFTARPDMKKENEKVIEKQKQKKEKAKQKKKEKKADKAKKENHEKKTE
jgi:hypothetical protein